MNRTHAKDEFGSIKDMNLIPWINFISLSDKHNVTKQSKYIRNSLSKMKTSS
jgi:hypothetical protein